MFEHDETWTREDSCPFDLKSNPLTRLGHMLGIICKMYFLLFNVTRVDCRQKTRARATQRSTPQSMSIWKSALRSDLQVWLTRRSIVAFFRELATLFDWGLRRAFLQSLRKAPQSSALSSAYVWNTFQLFKSHFYIDCQKENNHQHASKRRVFVFGSDSFLRKPRQLVGIEENGRDKRYSWLEKIIWNSNTTKSKFLFFEKKNRRKKKFFFF